MTLNDPYEVGFELVRTGATPAPPQDPIRAHVAYPIALDTHAGFAAVTFAALNIYERGWWCVAQVYREIDGVWTEFFEYDRATTDTRSSADRRTQGGGLTGCATAPS